MNNIKVTIELQAKDIWMKTESLTNWIHLFCLRWPYERPRILLNYVDHMTLQCCGRLISITEVINDLVLDNNTYLILHNKIIYDYSSLFSKNYYVNNTINVKPRFQMTLECFNQRKSEVVIKSMKNEYV